MVDSCSCGNGTPNVWVCVGPSVGCLSELLVRARACALYFCVGCGLSIYLGGHLTLKIMAFFSVYLGGHLSLKIMAFFSVSRIYVSHLCIYAFMHRIVCIE